MSTLKALYAAWPQVAQAATEEQGGPGPQPLAIPNIGRHQLGDLFRQLGFKVGAEIGTERGLGAASLLRGHPEMKLHCVDAWSAYLGYRRHVPQVAVDAFYEDALQRLGPMGATLHRGFSTDVAQEFTDGSLDFIYIDANHDLPHVIADLAAWEPKVRTGGIVAGDDFRLRGIRWNNGDVSEKPHVVQAVVAWTWTYNISPWFLLGEKDGKPGEIRNKARSFMWVKE